MALVIAKLGDDISTDVIYPGRYMATVLPAETPQYAFADLGVFNANGQRLGYNDDIVTYYNTDSSLTLTLTAGQRYYVDHTHIPKVQGGMGTAIVSTSSGVMTGHEARKAGGGGEVVAFIW